MIETRLAKHSKTLFEQNLPWPHIVFDGFFSENTLRACCREARAHKSWVFDTMSGYQEDERNSQVNKFWYPGGPYDLKHMTATAPQLTSILQYLNSSDVLHFLEELTGIDDLIPDYTFEGGGLHKITGGGRLEVHQDYTRHPTNKDLYRRVNLLLYMNPGWAYNGDLELYTDRETCWKKISPQFNRAVIFNTTGASLHGHPEPLLVPEDVSRFSIAMYYFTKEKPTDIEEHSGAIWHIKS